MIISQMYWEENSRQKDKSFHSRSGYTREDNRGMEREKKNRICEHNGKSKTEAGRYRACTSDSGYPRG
jgi:hypothetical protein